MENKKFIEKIREFFGVYEDEQIVELETWTNGGVNMHIVLRKDSDKSYLQQFEDYFKNFDVDEEIEIHRQDDYDITDMLDNMEVIYNQLKEIV